MLTSQAGAETPSSTAAEAAARPQVSLLLCTLGRTEPLARALAHFARQTSRAFEIVVVDQNPPGHLDATLQAYRTQLSIAHVRSTPGLSHARNVGLAACRGDIIGFPDDDCWYPPELIATIVARFASHPDWDILMGRTLDADGRESLGRFLSGDGTIDKNNLWFTGNSNTLFVRAAAAHAIGGFDETLGVGASTVFKSGEETDFVLRILARNARAIFQHDLIVHHDQVGDNAGAAGWKRAKAYAPGFGRVLRLHDYGIAYVTLRVLRTLASAGIALLRGDMGEVRYKLLWARGTVEGYRAPIA
jgi:glycosyltransferase involved in cell wall biosynthesis